MVTGKDITVEAYFLKRIKALKQEGRYATSRNYLYTWESFHGFAGKRVRYFDDLSKETIVSYNRYLESRGLVRNTISFYNRVLRSVYNQAVEMGYAKQANPFEKVYTGVDKTRKRALSADALRRLSQADLPDPEMALSRDLFIFSFQARGMSFVDMAFLKRQNLRAGAIHYIRRKTGQALVVAVEPWMQEILDRYSSRCFGSYLLPILHSEEADSAFRQYAFALGRHNRTLHRIGELLGFDFPLSSYCARHSWATVARDSSVPLSVISSGMGHTSERTTQIYLDTLENSLVDQAARKVWESICSKKK